MVYRGRTDRLDTQRLTGGLVYAGVRGPRVNQCQTRGRGVMEACCRVGLGIGDTAIVISAPWSKRFLAGVIGFTLACSG